MDLPVPVAAVASLPAHPPRRRGLAVSTDTVRLASMAAKLREQQYNEVTACSDTASAMAELRGGNKFDVVVFDMYSLRNLPVPALELLDCAVDEMHVETHAISDKGSCYGPIGMEDLNKIRKDIYNEPSNGFESPEANGSCNSSPVMTTPTTPTLLISGRRATRRRVIRTQVSDANSQEELDGRNVKNEHQNQKPKKPRLVWTDELHNKFLEAHDALLPQGDAVPKKILELMNEPTLTRENIASHLQKHRMNIDPLRRGNPKTKLQKLTPPQASSSSPNLSQQQASPTMTQPLSSSNLPETLTKEGAVNMNHNMKEHMQSFKECVLSDVASKDVYNGDNKSERNSMWCPDSADITEILDKDPKPSWDLKYLFYNGD
ncbi:hypothetical protein D1007_16085 [Hordeum vulgare]|nr:hypothetical protein D1007_16085 [Hordeum vulgare]